ncbi:hypothetical protein BASA60_006153 [Batrachochytrium salamandrivorans]|nr:hypothetical protein BASA60_006153 [Batrachochytrium salamandrivorans]
MQQPPMDSGDTYPSHSISAGSGAVDAIDMSHSAAAAADDPAETPSKRYSNVARRPTLFRKVSVTGPSSTRTGFINDTNKHSDPAVSTAAAASATATATAALLKRSSSSPHPKNPAFSTLGRRGTLRNNANNGTLHPPNHNMLAKPMDNSTPTLWVFVSWVLTCCFPSPALVSVGISTKGSRQAWREKVALCWIAAFLSAIVVIFLVFFNSLLCPDNLLDNTVDINAFGGVVVFGRMYNSFMTTPPYNTLFDQTDAFGGIDVSGSFEQPPIAACQTKAVASFSFSKVASTCSPNCINLNDLTSQHNFLPYATITGIQGQNVSVIPDPAYEWSEVRRRKLVVIRHTVLNLAPYFDAFPDAIVGDRMDLLLRKAQTINDGTHLLWKYPDVTPDMVNCLIQKYYAGVLSQLPMSCILSRLITIVVSLTVVSILLTRFAMALFFDWFMASHLIRFPKNAPDNHYDTVMSLKLNSQHPLKSHMSKDISIDMRSDMAIPIRPLQRTGTILLRQDPTIQRPVPNPSDLYTVLFVTCYSESESALRTTLDSLASTDYDDCKKILFVVADGIVQGAGNSASTPDLLMRMMHYDYSFGETPEAFSYVAVATGVKQHNMARVYCGSYSVNGRHIPMILVIKCGTEYEAGQSKPGNRGKRDSQLILMNFLSRVVLYDRMTPLDYDIFRKIHHLTGVTPDVFDLVLMVDADTRVAPDSLRFMVNAMHNEPRIMGLCGETRIANKKDSWVTMIQVFEYFISHHLGKAFESVFGGVTCLPGCFCMYRIKTIKDGSILPILANPDIIEQYATNETFTLHQKNLLLLGEDRFL